MSPSRRRPTSYEAPTFINSEVTKATTPRHATELEAELRFFINAYGFRSRLRRVSFRSVSLAAIVITVPVITVSMIVAPVSRISIVSLADHQCPV